LVGPFTGGAGATMNDVTIAHNTVQASQNVVDGVNTGIIQVDTLNTNRLSIVGNTIDEGPLFNERRAGILVDSGFAATGYLCINTTIVGNTITLADSVAVFRIVAGIFIGECAVFTVTGNTIQANQTAGGQADAINVNASTDGSITGNVLQNAGFAPRLLTLIGSNARIFATGNVGTMPPNQVGNLVIVNSQNAANIDSWFGVSAELGALNLDFLP